MTPFEPDGVYNSIPYRVLPDCSIEAMMPGGLVKFKDMDQLVATSRQRRCGQRSAFAIGRTKRRYSGTGATARLLLNSPRSNQRDQTELSSVAGAGVRTGAF